MMASRAIGGLNPGAIAAYKQRATVDQTAEDAVTRAIEVGLSLRANAAGVQGSQTDIVPHGVLAHATATEDNITLLHENAALEKKNHKLTQQIQDLERVVERLWQRGSNKHVESHKRFFLVLRRT